MNKEEILAAIKDTILSILPDAKVMLFGSRARGDWHEESDWDILVLTNEEVNYKLKEKVQNAVFSIGLSIGSFIHTILINTQQWQQHPGWHCLSEGIKDETIVL